MCRRVVLLLLLVLPLPAWAGDAPSTGLMWNRSGLPATLPLIVKTMPPRDVAVFLAAEPGDPPMMAAYIRGGALLRLLVRRDLGTSRWRMGRAGRMKSGCSARTRAGCACHNR